MTDEYEHQRFWRQTVWINGIEYVVKSINVPIGPIEVTFVTCENEKINFGAGKNPVSISK